VKALLLEAPGAPARVMELDEASLPDGDVTVSIDYSTLNYKDALALTHRAPIVRAWPMIPGIDFAGRVERSGHPSWKPGDAVLVNGHQLGEMHWGGLAQKARLSGAWLIAIPKPLTPRHAMSIGTAGYTAALALLALERHGLTPQSGEVLVTGARGGLGSIALMLLSARGYIAVASTGRPSEADALRVLGATEVIDRAVLAQTGGKPLQKSRWAGVIDSVGGETLANALASTLPHGAAAACGNASGMHLPATVAPFILRGVSLLGIDSNLASRADREAAWTLLAQSLDLNRLAAITREIPLASAAAAAEDLLAGRVAGRLLVNVNS
jgi:acrylyl-CoA reductase (NADPH)